MAFKKSRGLGIIVATALLPSLQLAVGLAPKAGASPQSVPPITSSPTKPNPPAAKGDFTPSEALQPKGRTPAQGKAPSPSVSPQPPVHLVAPLASPTPAEPAGTEIKEKRTASSKTFSTGEAGKYQTKLYTARVHYKDAQGNFQDIDNHLVSRSGHFHNAASDVDVDLSSDRSQQLLAKVTRGNLSIGFGLSGQTQGAASVDSTGLHHHQILPGVDLTLAPTYEGLKDEFSLSSPAAPDTFVFPISSSGLSPEVRASGDLWWVDQAGKGQAVTPKGFMSDSNVDPHSGDGARSDGVSYQIISSGGQSALQMTLDRSWLDDPARVFPVKVDPPVEYIDYDAEDDTTVTTNFTRDAAGDMDLHAGTYDGGVHLARTFMNFDTSFLAGKSISQAWLDMNEWWSWSCSPRGLGVYRVTQPWYGHTMTSWPGASYGEQVAWGSYAMGYNSSCPGGFFYYNVAAAVQNWANGTWPSYGLMLQVDPGSETDNFAYKKFWSRNYASTYNCPLCGPFIDVYWTAAASIAPPAAPANGSTFHSLTPALSVGPASDPDGDPVSYWFRVAKGSDAEAGDVYDTNWISSTSVSIPAGILSWNTTYYWHVYTYDGSVLTGPNWVWSFTPVNSPPTMANPISPANGSSFHTLTPTLSSTTSTDPNGDPVIYLFRVATGADAETGVVYDSGWISSTHATIPSSILAFATTYYWHVWTSDGYVLTAPNWVWSFTPVNHAPPAPPLYSPASGSTVGTATPLLQVSPVADPDGDTPVSYDFKVATGSDGQTGLVAESGWTTSTSWAPSALQDGAIYYFTAAARDPYGAQSSYTSPASSFSIDLRLGEKASMAFDRLGPVEVNLANANVVVKAASRSFGSLGGGLGVSFSYNSQVPQGASSTGLPDGWMLSASGGSYSYLRATPNRATFVDATGAIHPYANNSGLSFAPLSDEDGVVGASSTSGPLTLHGPDGGTYAFSTDGTLTSRTSAPDDKNPASATYTWSSGRLTKISDPVSGRAIYLTYAPSACPSASGFDASPPSGMLCKIDYSDFSAGESDYFYSGGHLARMKDPGSEISDFGYDSSGRLTQIRDSLTNDLIASGTFSDPSSDTHKYLVAYDSSAKASSITAPTPDAAGSPRPTHSYDWSPAVAKVHVAGVSEPNGYAMKVTTNAYGGVVEEKDAAADTTTYTWDPSGERVSSVTDPMGRLTTHIYDQAGRMTDTYGPGQASEFGTDLRSATAPHSSTAYDESIAGLAAAYWSNTSLSGAPIGHETGVGEPTGALSKDWGTSAPASIPAANAGHNWSARYTGEIAFAQAGTYTFQIYSADGARVFIDDAPLIDAWYDHSGYSSSATFTNPAAASRHRIRVDFYNHTSNPRIELDWTPPGASGFSVVPGSNLLPRYGLATSAVDPDQKKTQTQFQAPELGLATASVLDPAGLALRTSTAYETPGTGYLRRISKTMPSGSSTSFSYFGATETASNPCPGGASSINQAGLLKTETSPAIVHEYRYDQAGRLAASRITGDANWTCISYDSRGRVASSSDSSAKTTSFSYATPGVVTKSYQDSAGTSRTTVSRLDWAQRPSSYTDENATTTRVSYDQASRPTSSYRQFSGSLEAGLETYSYDVASRVSSINSLVSAGGAQVSFGYDLSGALTSISRPNKVTTTRTYDASRGWLSSISHTNAAGAALSSFSYAHAPSGRISSQTSPYLTRSYAYDGAGRLTSANDSTALGPRVYAYDKNSNRCSSSSSSCDGTYSYDSADRLTSSPYASAYTYDSHGNLTSATPKLASNGVALSEAITYDGADHATSVNDGVTKVSEVLSSSGRVLHHSAADAITGILATDQDLIYGYAGEGDSPAYQKLAGGATITFTSGPGGLLIIDTNGVPTYPLYNEHGDVAGTTDASGAFTQAPQTDEFGRQSLSLAPAPNRLGWLGAHERFSVGGLLGIMRMGQRLYDPALGRFLEVDPVEGGSANDYDYVHGDPVNQVDLDGRADLKRFFRKRIGKYTAERAFTETFKALFPYYEGGTEFLAERLVDLAHALKVRKQLIDAMIEASDDGPLSELRLKDLEAQLQYYIGRALVKNSQKEAYDYYWDRCFGGLGINRCS